MEPLQMIYENLREYGGFLFLGSCILVGAYWIRGAILNVE